MFLYMINAQLHTTNDIVMKSMRDSNTNIVTRKVNKYLLLYSDDSTKNIVFNYKVEEYKLIIFRV